MARPMTAQDMEKLFRRMNELLKKDGKEAEILVCGGASIAFLYDETRATLDIDGLIATGKQDVQRYTRWIAEEEGLEEDWFNEAAKGYIDTDWKTEEVLKLSNLEVKSVAAEPLLAMKLYSSRRKSRDQEDAVRLMRHLDIKSSQEALQIVENQFAARPMLPKVRFFTEETFAIYEAEKDIEIGDLEVDERNTIHLPIRKEFVNKNVVSKDGAQTYHQVTMPENLRVDGKDLGGYMCFPIYVDADWHNEKIYNIPFQAGYMVRLTKGSESIEIEAEKLKEGLKASYKEWRIEQERFGENPPKEKVDIRQLVKAGLKKTLEDNKGEEVYPSDIRNQVRGYILEKGKEVDTLSYIKDHYDEALEIRKQWKDKGIDLDILREPEVYYAQMADKIYAEEIEKKVPLLTPEPGETIPLIKRNINLIKWHIGQNKDKSKTKSKDTEIE
jgi:hypothetical protein